MTQDRLLTSLNWRPMVGSAVATMVWSSAARNIVSNRLIRMVRTSSGLSGAGGAIGGASPTSMTSVVMRESSLPISSGNVVWSAGSRPCRWCLFMSDAIFFCAAKAAEMESPYALDNKAQITCAADACTHGCIPSGSHRVLVMAHHAPTFRPSPHDLVWVSPQTRHAGLEHARAHRVKRDSPVTGCAPVTMRVTRRRRKGFLFARRWCFLCTAENGHAGIAGGEDR